MRQRVEISAIHPGLTAAGAYSLLRAYGRNVRLIDLVRSVRTVGGDDGSWISFWEVKCERGTLRWSQYDELDDANQRVRFRRRDGDLAELEAEWSAAEDTDGCRIRFDCLFDLGVPGFNTAPGRVAARALRESVTWWLEEIFGPELRLEGDRRRELAVAAGI